MSKKIDLKKIIMLMAIKTVVTAIVTVGIFAYYTFFEAPETEIYEPIVLADNIRTHSVDVVEADLLNGDWDQTGFPVKLWDGLMRIVGQPILTEEQAINVAISILESLQEGNVFYSEFELMLIRYDAYADRWNFIYWEPHLLGSDFSVLMDGETGEIIEMWVQ
ncbi:MAG: hypothetical protein FWC79_00695 [Oscillospiraceae bacterium]|nr:hypothetical protein [Oscillospiraceae bacterium]